MYSRLLRLLLRALERQFLPWGDCDLDVPHHLAAWIQQVIDMLRDLFL